MRARDPRRVYMYIHIYISLSLPLSISRSLSRSIPLSLSPAVPRRATRGACAHAGPATSSASLVRRTGPSNLAIRAIPLLAIFATGAIACPRFARIWRRGSERSPHRRDFQRWNSFERIQSRYSEFQQHTVSAIRTRPMESRNLYPVHY